MPPPVNGIPSNQNGLEKLFGGVSQGAGLISNILAPTPGNSNTTGSSSGSSSYNQFLESLVNAVVQSYNTNLTNSSSSQEGSTTPNLNPQTQGFLDQLIKQYSSIIKPVDTQGLQANTIQGINNNSNLQSQSAQQILASRGLASSPTGASTMANIDNQRFGRINEFENSLPLLTQNLNLNNLNAAGGFFSRIPYGTTTTGSQSGTQSGVQQNNQSSSTSSNQSSTGTQQQQQQQQSETKVPGKGRASTIAGIAGGIGSVLAGLFSDKRLKEDIKPVNRAVEKILALRPVTYKWKDDSIDQGGLGVIAQDLEKVLPELVHKDKTTGFRKVDYAGLIPVLVGAVQELALANGEKNG